MTRSAIDGRSGRILLCRRQVPPALLADLAGQLRSLSAVGTMSVQASTGAYRCSDVWPTLLASISKPAAGQGEYGPPYHDDVLLLVVGDCRVHRVVDSKTMSSA